MEILFRNSVVRNTSYLFTHGLYIRNHERDLFSKVPGRASLYSLVCLLHRKETPHEPGLNFMLTLTLSLALSARPTGHTRLFLEA